MPKSGNNAKARQGANATRSRKAVSSPRSRLGSKRGNATAKSGKAATGGEGAQGGKTKRERPVKIPIAKGDYLSECGWTVHRDEDDRRSRLVDEVHKRGYKPIALRLNAVAIRLKNNAPDASQKARADQQWLRQQFRENKNKNKNKEQEREQGQEQEQEQTTSV